MPPGTLDPGSGRDVRRARRCPGRHLCDMPSAQREASTRRRLDPPSPYRPERARERPVPKAVRSPLPSPTIPCVPRVPPLSRLACQAPRRPGSPLTRSPLLAGGFTGAAIRGAQQEEGAKAVPGPSLTPPHAQDSGQEGRKAAGDWLNRRGATRQRAPKACTPGRALWRERESEDRPPNTV